MNQNNVDEMINYMGNPNLKSANVKLSYSKEQIEEYLKCSKDPMHFISNYVKIITLDEGIVQFGMWPFQKNLIENFIKNRFTKRIM